MSVLLIPDDILETLVCLTCNKYLSQFPVYVKPDNTGGICGRCPRTDEDGSIRDEAYEGIAQFLLFPCMYKVNGCPEKLTPPKLEPHEKRCVYHKFDCPTKAYSSCEWQGARLELLSHFEEKHKAMILKDPKFEVNFLTSLKENVLFPFGEELFVVRREIDSPSGTFSCSMQYLPFQDDDKSYKYFLKVETQKRFYKFPARSINGDENTTKFTHDDVRLVLNDPATIIINIEIVGTNNVEVEVDIEDSIDQIDIKNDPNINWPLLGELECPVCIDFMFPPIYQCVIGHSICGDCKTKVAACPTCKGAFQNTKNYVLEKMTDVLTYPCTYYKTGCCFSSKATDIKNHIKTCGFAPYECPLKEPQNCTWKAKLSEMNPHITNNHDAYLLKTDKISIPFDKDRSEELCYLIQFSGQVFKLSFKYADKVFQWTLQLVGLASECKNFKYEIDVIDHSPNKRRRYCIEPCSPLTEHAKRFDNVSNKLVIPFEQIEPLISTSFTYKIHILK